MISILFFLQIINVITSVFITVVLLALFAHSIWKKEERYIRPLNKFALFFHIYSFYVSTIWQFIYDYQRQQHIRLYSIVLVLIVHFLVMFAKDLIGILTLQSYKKPSVVDWTVYNSDGKF